MATPPDAGDEEFLGQNEKIRKILQEALPFNEFVRTFGPINWGNWVRCLAGDPAARARVRSLVGDKGLTSGVDIPDKIWPQLLKLIQGHPALRQRVRREYHLELTNMMRAPSFAERLKAPKVKSEEWKELYVRLAEILKRFGKDDPCERGDFFLVDDEVGEPCHKIEVQNPDILSREMIGELQRALEGWENAWYVLITLHFDHVNPKLDPGMLLVRPDHVDEDFDRKQYKSLLGARFKL